MPLNVADIKRAELMLTRHVQHSVFGCVYVQLSLDAEQYRKAVAKIKHTELKHKMIQLANLKLFIDSDGVLWVWTPLQNEDKF